MYNTIVRDVSAVVETLTTLIMGSLSDKIGKRKIFIVFGYIIWAFSVAAFSFINSSSSSAILVIVLDCVMTFFGSTANDAAFNAYVTEKIDQRDRTKTEAVIQILPLCSILIIFGLLDSFTQRGEWPLFFFIVALLMLLSGILSIFLLDNDCGKKKEESTLSCLLFGFRRKTVKDNKNLYITLPAYALSALGMQVFFPYLIIYMSTFPGFESNYNALLAVVIIVSSVITVIASRRLNHLPPTHGTGTCIDVLRPFISLLTHFRHSDDERLSHQLPHSPHFSVTTHRREIREEFKA